MNTTSKFTGYAVLAPCMGPTKTIGFSAYLAELQLADRVIISTAPSGPMCV